MKLALGGDSAGAPLIAVIKQHLAGRTDIEVVDLSVHPEGEREYYAEMAERVSQALLSGAYDRAVLCCGTGIGVSIAANKMPGIRAALTHDTYSAERASKSNNANVITMGARVIGPEHAKVIVDTWLRAAFDPAGPSAANVQAIDTLDARRRRSL